MHFYKAMLLLALAAPALVASLAIPTPRFQLSNSTNSTEGTMLFNNTTHIQVSRHKEPCVIDGNICDGASGFSARAGFAVVVAFVGAVVAQSL
jgi:hypothetical protein